MSIKADLIFRSDHKSYLEFEIPGQFESFVGMNANVLHLFSVGRFG